MNNHFILYLATTTSFLLTVYPIVSIYGNLCKEIKYPFVGYIITIIATGISSVEYILFDAFYAVKDNIVRKLLKSVIDNSPCLQMASVVNETLYRFHLI